MRRIMILSLLLLSIMMIGAVNATDNATDDAFSLKENSDDINNEAIGQTYDDRLSSPKAYDIYDFNALNSALTSDEYDQVTISIKSNIKLKGNTNVSGSIKSLVINGNGKTIYGNGEYQFLSLKNTTLTLKDLEITYCKGFKGGAIKCEGDNTSITNCLFSNCRACGDSNNPQVYGGAIYTSASHITISNNRFEENGEQNSNSMNGGAIYNCGNDVKITGNEFDCNYAGCGGAIYNAGENCMISKNEFKYNRAGKKGNAIYNSGACASIESNTFKLNINAAGESNVIQSYKEDTQITDNEYVYTQADSKGTISNYGSGVKIKGNTFDDRAETTITAPKSVKYGKDIVIILKDSDGEPLGGLKVSVNFNKAKTYKTDVNGKIKIPADGLVPGKYKLKIKFKGNRHYTGSALNADLTVKKATPKIIAKSKAFKKKASKKYEITIKGSAGKAIKKTKVTLKIAGKSYKAKTSSKGKATFNIKLSKKGKYRATITSKGNSCYSNETKKVKIIIK